MTDSKQKNSYKPRLIVNNRVRQALLVGFAFILLHFITYILDPVSDSSMDYISKNKIQILVEWLFNLIFCFLISEFSTIVHKRLNILLPWHKNKSKRLFTEFFLNLIIVIVLIFLNLFCCIAFYSFNENKNVAMSLEEVRWLKQWLIVSAVISFLIIVINIVTYLVDSFVETTHEFAKHKIKAAEFKQASIEAELNSLKMQLDPHFIFNNLSVLSELILKDQNLGYEYSENFARVYRFLLVNSKNNLISVEEEISFLNSYIFLVKQRLGDGVVFSIELQETERKMMIPPLTLQLLVENAIKHNTTNKRKPLQIVIRSVSRGIIEINNSLSLIERNKSVSTRIGLDNIMNRFLLLDIKIPEVNQDQNSFKVIVFLTEYDKYRNNN